LDGTKFGAYKGSGYVRSVKQVKHFSFASLAESLKQPQIVESDFAKFGRPQQLHTIFQALNDYTQQSEGNELPRPYNATDAKKLIEIVNKRQEEAKADAIPEQLVTLLSYTCRGNLNPMAAFFGGIAAQEVQKACTGKFHPLSQWLYFDAFECLNTSEDLKHLPSEASAAPVNGRYDGQLVVFGREFQDKVLSTNMFLVGSGALGCEYLKNFAMMGIGCGKGNEQLKQKAGRVVVTDMDNIELTNLNRQFLFRKKHIGSMKSAVAAQVVKQMNADLNIKSMNDKVAPQTEQTFDDEFWDSMDCITNALDNVQARLYVDSRCVFYRKPLIEAGTLGTKTNVQIVVPGLTESYASSPDPPEKEILEFAPWRTSLTPLNTPFSGLEKSLKASSSRNQKT